MSTQKTDTAAVQPAPIEPPRPEISGNRVAVMVLVLCALVFGGWKLVDDQASTAARSAALPVYAPYVDVTQTPTYPFQLPSANPVSSVYLAFVVSDLNSPCTPSWGTYYTLNQANRSLALDARVAQVQKEGGSVMVSFGGQDHTELAVDCTSPDSLAAAYDAPIKRYHAGAIDLDLEGATLTDAAANIRRATAIAAIQRKMAAHHKTLGVWLTLPVSNEGLTAEGLAAVRAMLAAHVTLAGVNAMAMDFGPDEGASHDMEGVVQRSLSATQVQVQSLWHAAGLPSSTASAWGHVGVTVMLGVNGEPAQRFTTNDARLLAAYVESHGIPRVSVWSLNRDSQCGEVFAPTGVISNTCSGVLQKLLQFTQIFGALRGTKIAQLPTGSSTSQPGTTTVATDNPATSPYPIWRSTAAYQTGYKVVWQGEIFEASWWNQGTPPNSSTGDSPSGPWQPVGPVPPGSHAPKPVVLVSDAFKQWSPKAVYQQGDRISFDGLPYQARWYSHGQQPLPNLPADPSMSWEPLFKYPGEPTGASIGAEETN